MVGVGSGAGHVYMLARSLVRRCVEANTKLRARDVHLVSLSGGMHVRQHSEVRPDRTADPARRFEVVGGVMDSDQILSLLSLAFPQPVHPLPNLQPIVGVQSDAEVLRVRSGEAVEMRQPLIEGRRFVGKELLPQPLTQALLGVGSWGPGHRLFDFAMRRDANVGHDPMSLNPPFAERPGDEILTPIQSELSSLMSGCDRLARMVQNDDYVPVGDLANFLFVVPVPPGVSEEAKRTAVALQDAVDAVNDKLFTVKADVLQAIPGLVLKVAGTLPKARILFGLLRAELYHVRHLCLDERSARHIIRLADEDRRSPPM